MLVRFSVENYRSFNERQVFSMAAGKHTRLKDQVVSINGKRLLKAGVLFGANAAGKSNLIKAIHFGRNIALDGVTPGNLYNRNFRIDSESIKRPCVLQFDLYSNGHFYSYGFAVSYLDAKFVSEWLYITDGEKERLVFERDGESKIATEIKFVTEENAQRFQIYAEDVTDQKSFLSEVVSHKLNGIEEFRPFFDVKKWFESIIVIFPTTKFRSFGRLMSGDTLDSMGGLLNYFDTGIDSLNGEEKSLDEALSFLPEDIRNQIKNDVLETISVRESPGNKTVVELTIADRRFSFSRNERGELTAVQLMMNHGNPGDLFELMDESDGTKRLFDLLPLYKKGKQDAVVLVDELDRSFHTKLTIEYIRKFFEKTRGASTQLIATLHDSCVMNLNYLRQDEIWFVERKEDHSSELYSLNKFKERFDRTVAKDYLLGRYGAVPNFGVDPWEEEDEEEDGKYEQ